MPKNTDKIKKTIASHDQKLEDISAIPGNLPLLPLRDIVLFPNMVVPILVAREASVEALQTALINDRYIFLVLQKDPEVEIPGKEDLYRIGVIGRALQILKLPNGTAKVLIEGIVRASFTNFQKIDKHYSVDLTITSRKFEDSFRIKALVRNVVSSFTTYIKLSKAIPDEVLMNIPAIDDPQRLADTIGAHLIINTRNPRS